MLIKKYSLYLTVITAILLFTSQFLHCAKKRLLPLDPSSNSTSSTGANVTTTSFTIGGTVSGIPDGGTTSLELNSGEELTQADGTFEFNTNLSANDSYVVTATGGGCEVINGIGSVEAANVDDIEINCGGAFPVDSVYSNGQNILDYVNRDGATLSDAGDVVCDGSELELASQSCIHGGFLRQVVYSKSASCDGYTMIDSLGLFSWDCEELGLEIRFIGSDTSNNVTMSALIDWESCGTTNCNFLENYVELNFEGNKIASSLETEWWTNSIQVLSNTGGSLVLSDSGSIFVALDDITGNIAVNSPNTGVVIHPDRKFTGSGGGNVVETSQSFTWFEGEFDASGMTTGLYINNAIQVKLIDVSVAGASADGVELEMTDFAQLARVTANNNDIGIRIHNDSNFNEGSFFTTTNNAQYGLNLADATTTNNDFNYLFAQSNNAGIRLDSANSNDFRNVTVKNHGFTGINIKTGAADNTFTTVTASSNSTMGFAVDGPNNEFKDITVLDSGSHGFSITEPNNIIEDIYISGTVNLGINLNGAPNTLMKNVTVEKAGTTGIWVQSSDNSCLNGGRVSASSAIGINIISNSVCITNAVVDNSANTGILVEGAYDTKLQMVTSAFNGGHGVKLDLFAVSGVIAGLTTIGNLGNGLEITSSQDVTVVSLLAVNNAGIGLNLTDPFFFNNWFHTIRDITVAHNGIFAIADADFTGMNDFRGSIRFSGTCNQSGFLGDPGFNNACDSTDTPGINSVADLTNEFEGLVTDDDVLNESDADGSQNFDDIEDWLNFENRMRVYGPTASSILDSAARGPCTSGSCSIYDVRPTDETNIIGSGVVPDIPNTGNHNYTVGGAINYLLGATEIAGGNENVLCEVGETCLVMEHYGAYGGEFSLDEADYPVSSYSAAGYDLRDYPGF